MPSWKGVKNRLFRTDAYQCKFYEFRPFLEEVIALRLGALSLVDWIMRESYRGCEPLYQRRGVTYIECAGPLQPSVTQGSMYIKTRRYW